METRPHNEANGSNSGIIKWNIKTEAEESAEYPAALEAKLNRLSTSNRPQLGVEATQAIERPIEDGLASDEDIYVAYGGRHDAGDRQDSDDADEGLHLLHEEGRPLRKQRPNEILNGIPTFLKGDLAQSSHAAFTHASPISSEEQLLQSTPEPPETDLTAENTEHELTIPVCDKRPRTKVIRFFSRVRIASGVSRGRSPRRAHRDPSTPRLSDMPQRSRGDSGSYSGASSISDSSSFSAPLRSPSSAAPRIAAMRQNSKTGRQAVVKQQRPRAELSQILDLNSTSERLKSVAVQDQQRHAARKGRTWDETLSQRREMERRRKRMRDAPALSAWAPIIDNDSEDEAERTAAEALRKTEADVLYGRWPWRLFSFYYWESLCSTLCSCADSDLEDGRAEF